jgi:hypothetical protein
MVTNLEIGKHDQIVIDTVRNGGTIRSTLESGDPDDADYNVAVTGLQSLILAHACAGINVRDPKYCEGIETALDAIANHLG